MIINAIDINEHLKLYNTYLIKITNYINLTHLQITNALT
jgi:hypothetical protein